MEIQVTEDDLVNFLKQHLKLEIKETTNPFQPANVRELDFRIVLKRAGESIVLGSDSLTITEGR